MMTHTEKLAELLDCALDFIGESNAIRMIGAREFYAEARAVLAAHQQPAPTVLSDGGPPCSKDPNAPHGFNRDGSHTMGRYVCDCEGYAPIPAHPPAQDTQDAKEPK